uniref:C2H2-type domain-containing protein n=1 Tax=Plectus sambesii TaxID=2011161 RepID=A0A914VMA8_9BILA
MSTTNGDTEMTPVSNDDQTPISGEIVVDRPDLWQTNKCIVCHAKYFSETAKRRHVETEAHKKRVMVHDFFLNEVSSFKPSESASSFIIEKISKCSDSFIGTECLHEFVFTDGVDPFWACSVCYCAGRWVDDVAAHLASTSHRMNYIEEYHPDRKPKGRTAKEIAIELKQATEAIVALQTTSIVPEVIELNMVPQNAASKLGLSMPTNDQSIEPVGTVPDSAPTIAHQTAAVGYKVCNRPLSGDEGRLLQCESCWEVIRVASVKQVEKEWEEHLASTRHVERAQLRQSFLFDKSSDLNEPSRLEDALKSESKNEWKFDTPTNAWLFQGQIVGLEYLIERVERRDKLTRAKRDVVCLLCLQEMPITPTSVVEAHMRSESHIVAYLHKELPTVIDDMLTASASSRRELIGAYLMTSKIGKSRIRVCSGIVKYAKDDVPPHSNQIAAQKPSSRKVKDDVIVQPCEFKVTTLDDGEQAIWCEACWQMLFVPAKSNDVGVQSCWQKHSRQQSHINMLKKRKLFDFDEEGFVDGISRLKPPPVEENGQETVKASTWKNEASVGLDFVIERHRPNKAVDVVCLLCAEVLPCKDEIIHRHVKSEQHAIQFLHSCNIPMLKLLEKHQSESARRRALLDFLKKTPPTSGAFRIYHPRLAAALRQWGSVPASSLAAALMPDQQRSVSLIVAKLIDDVCGPNDPPQMVPIKDALVKEGLTVLDIEEDDVLLWCNVCWQTIVVPLHDSPIDRVWCGHLRSAVHKKKKAQREQLHIDDRCFLKKEKSEVKVADVSTVAKSEKAHLRGKDRDQSHFIDRVVGLKYVIDRRSVDGASREKSDLFCLMCLKSIARRSVELTAHVRSVEHVLQYLHKHKPTAIRQLDKQPLKDAKLRSFVTSAVRPLSDDRASFIRVYDPLGVTNKQRSLSERPKDSRRQPKEEHKEKKAEASSKVSRASNRREDASSSKTSVSKCEEKRPKRTENPSKPSSSSKSISSVKTEVMSIRDNSSKCAEPTASAQSTATTTVTTKSQPRAIIPLDLVEKLLASTNEEIADSERPTALNAYIDATGGCLGVNLVYEVVCADDAYFKSYFCSVCSILETADQIIKHLLTDEHRLAFLSAFYKMHYKAVMKQSDAAKSGALKQYALQVEQIEGKHQVTRRLQYQLDSFTVSQVWPDYRSSTERATRIATSEVALQPPPPGIEDDVSIEPLFRLHISESEGDTPPPPDTHFTKATLRRSSSGKNTNLFVQLSIVCPFESCMGGMD